VVTPTLWRTTFLARLGDAKGVRYFRAAVMPDLPCKVVLPPAVNADAFA